MFSSIITEPTFYVFAVPAVIFLGLAKGGFSGAATAATPLLALYLPPLEAAALLLPILICQDAISVGVYWREWSVKNVKALLPGAALGVALGWLFASYVSQDAIRVLIGATAIAFVVNIWSRAGRVEPQQGSLLGGLFWGTISGFASFASQGGGPPFQVYTLRQHMPKMLFVGTATIFFAAVNIMKVVPYLMLSQFSAKNVSTSVALLPIAVMANFAGIWLVKRVPTEAFFTVTYIFLLVLGGALVWGGSSGLWHSLEFASALAHV
jgi:uncharacterized protein